jgi:hypothetical protein
MSRNKKRLEATELPEKLLEGANIQVPRGDQLNFSVPTEIVELPSEGKLYDASHPLHNQKTVEIKYMTAKEEDILTSPSLIKTGQCLDRLLKSVIISAAVDPSTLYSSDRNAILIAARKTGFGSDYRTGYVCPKCGSDNEEVFDLDEAKIVRPTPESLAASGLECIDGVYYTTLPSLKVQVGIRPLTYESENKISKASQRKLELGLSESVTTDTLREMIVSIATSEEPSLINQVIDSMPVLDSRHIRKMYSLITPRVSFEHEVECRSCGRESRLEVPFDTDFFWPEL